MDYKDEYEKEMERLEAERAREDARRDFRRKTNKATLKDTVISLAQQEGEDFHDAEQRFRSILFFLLAWPLSAGVATVLIEFLLPDSRLTKDSIPGAVILTFPICLVWARRRLKSKLGKGGSNL